ncbi:MAG: hypothetical protein M1816_000536 [Peltula sp. TS41687]|nr:MAG: hypothetical protein M1816_000536 [Peltula sp. TS41687]
MSEELDQITVQVPPVDPDAQATVTDFLDYTEYLPADLIRSLTLIRKLDESYRSNSSKVHELTKLYGSLPSLSGPARPDPATLRSEISHYLNHAIDSRTSAYAEADRLYDVVDHHFNRLTSIKAKLQALPLPPSRDPSPVPQPAASQQANRSRRGRNADEADHPGPRITLRLDATRSAGGGRSGAPGGRRKERSRRVTIPGEVLPPPNPDSPLLDSDSGWDSAPLSSVQMPTSRVGGPSRTARSASAALIKPPKPPKAPKLKAPKVPGGQNAAQTNTRSVPVGISTSSALAMLKPPPENALPGSEHAPWLKLTQWEMARLRKRMKKNAVWLPSETMIRRELAELGRGPENYHAAKARSEATGEPFVDACNIANADPGKKTLAEGEISVDSLGKEEIQLSNRGMKLNEAKKLKRENLQKEAAAQAAAQAAAEAQLGVSGVVEPGIDLNIVSTQAGEDVGQDVALVMVMEKDSNTSQKKRKRDTSAEAESEMSELEDSDAPIHKKRKQETQATAPATSQMVTTTTTTVPLAAPGPSGPTGSRASVDKSLAEDETAIVVRSLRQTSVASKAAAPDGHVSRPRSRGATAASEQMTTAGKDRPRRASTISTAAMESAQAARNNTRRSKRPVPGRLTADGGEGGPAVTVGKRAAAPRKKNGSKKPKGETQSVERGEEADEEGLPIDPNEPRYCVCGDVSFGTMIQCENSDVRVKGPSSSGMRVMLMAETTSQCEREWFHLECVGLSEPPGRTTKWYCPDCRKKLGVGEKGQVSARNKKK